ncbi:MAG: dipeptide epimerase [Pseudomonadota bacterium]
MEGRVELELWEYKRPFVIARGALTHALNLTITLEQDGAVGRGEAEPHESDFHIGEAMRDEAEALLQPPSLNQLHQHLSSASCSAPVRNAMDAALLDLEAKRTGVSVADRLEIAVPASLPVTGTVSLGTPEAMAKEALYKRAQCSIIKVKLGECDDRDGDRISAVRNAAPDHPLIVDANGGWTMAAFRTALPAMVEVGVDMIEQPLPPEKDHQLNGFVSPIDLCADEVLRDESSLAQLADCYSLINIKLDKCGGLSRGLELARKAKDRGLDYMVGSNGGTSLATAPAYLLAANGRYADIDSAPMLRDDRDSPMVFANGSVHAPSRSLWG